MALNDALMYLPTQSTHRVQAWGGRLTFADARIQFPVAVKRRHKVAFPNRGNAKWVVNDLRKKPIHALNARRYVRRVSQSQINGDATQWHWRVVVHLRIRLTVTS